ncbi:MAG TPA: DUF2145 domain-containing protein [Burkholderiaceae bacterium]
MKALASLLLVMAFVTGGPRAQAGQVCSQEPPTVSEIERGMALAQATADKLDASGAQVLLLARAGQDLGKYGLRWSHLGYVYRDEAGRWRVLHKLNECASAQGSIYRQGLGEFFMDRPYRYEAAYAVLKPELQAALLPLLRENGRVLALNEPHYNMLAYPFSTRYQQSNQWALETLVLAARPRTASREQAQAWLQLEGYRPTTLHLSAFTRLGANVTRANIAFDDHPNAKRFAGRIETVTADSMFVWLHSAGLVEKAEVIASENSGNQPTQ